MRRRPGLTWRDATDAADDGVERDAEPVDRVLHPALEDLEFKVFAGELALEQVVLGEHLALALAALLAGIGASSTSCIRIVLRLLGGLGLFRPDKDERGRRGRVRSEGGAGESLGRRWGADETRYRPEYSIDCSVRHLSGRSKYSRSIVASRSCDLEMTSCSTPLLDV